MPRIVGDHGNGPQQFAAIIPIAWLTKRAQKLVGMHLEDNGAGAHDFSPFRSLIAWRADLIKTPMGSRQHLQLR